MEDRYVVKTGTVYYVWDSKLKHVVDNVIDYVGTPGAREEADEMRVKTIANEKRITGGNI